MLQRPHPPVRRPTPSPPTIVPPPRSGERAIALDRRSDQLALEPGDRVDLYAVDDLTNSGRLLVSAARVLDLDDGTVTVAIPRRDVGPVATARRWGDIALALVPPD